MLCLQGLLFPTRTLCDFQPELCHSAVQGPTLDTQLGAASPDGMGSTGSTGGAASVAASVVRMEIAGIESGDATCIATADRSSSGASAWRGGSDGAHAQISAHGLAIVHATHAALPTAQQRLQLMASLLSQQCMAVQKQLLAKAVSSFLETVPGTRDGGKGGGTDGIAYVLELHAALVQLLASVVGELNHSAEPAHGEMTLNLGLCLG